MSEPSLPREIYSQCTLEILLKFFVNSYTGIQSDQFNFFLIMTRQIYSLFLKIAVLGFADMKTMCIV